jgi:signal transduction histidine kinase
MSASNNQPETYFAPAARADAQTVATVSQRAAQDRVVCSMLEAVPGFAMLLNEQRQIVAANKRLGDTIGQPFAEWIGKRPGEAVGCLHSAEQAGGCGTAEACSVCGAVQAIVGSKEQGQTLARECRLQLASDPAAALELETVATPLNFGDDELTVFFMRDISGEKRRRVLERFFFHDVLNTAGACEGLSRMLADGECEDAEEQDEFHKLLADGVGQLVEEIQSHRQLMAAEAGELEVAAQSVAISPLLEEVAGLCRHLDAAQNRELIVDCASDPVIVTDPGLLRRVLVNLVKNALEATASGGTVTLSAQTDDQHVVFIVHNPSAMPPDVKLQVFKRSFSTKGSGRGIGTYSIKLLSEGYLGGRVGFTSAEPDGTTFRVELPMNGAQT